MIFQMLVSSSPELSHELCTESGDNFGVAEGGPPPLVGQRALVGRWLAGWALVLAGCLALPVSPVAVAAAAVTPAHGASRIAELPGTRWQVFELRGRALALPQPFTLSFELQGLMQGQTRCNQYAATYRQQAEVLQIQALRQTVRPCPPDGLALVEQDFLAVLAGSRSHALDAQGHLVIFSTQGTLKAARLGPAPQQ